MVWIVNARYVEDFSIQVTFNDGTSGLVDFQETIEKDARPVVKELIDSAVFRAFEVSLDTICWRNGADFAPEYIYKKLQNATKVA